MYGYDTRHRETNGTRQSAQVHDETITTTTTIKNETGRYQNNNKWIKEHRERKSERKENATVWQ